MCAIMIAFYIVDLSTKTSRNVLFVDSIDSIAEKDGGDDENYNENRRNGGPKKVFWYFPIISHLKRWFANKEAELL
jgi:hypothetical protein